MAYAKINFVEGVTGVGPTNLGHMEDGIFNAAANADAAIPKPAVPTLNDALVWTGAAWVNQKIADAQIAAGANIQASKLNGYPADATKALRGDGSWAVVPQVPYRKTTSKTVNNTVAETDLLNGEITIGAGVIGTTGMLRCTFFIDALNNSGGAATWRFKVKLGGTIVLDSTAISVPNNGSPRVGVKFGFSMLNSGATNANICIGELRIPAVSVSNLMVVGSGGAPADIGTGEKWWVGEGVGTSAIDTSTAKLLEATVTHGTAAATIETKLYGAVVEVI